MLWQQPQKQLEWIERIVTSEYADATDKADYKYFLENKFPFVKKERQTYESKFYSRCYN